MNTKNFLTGGFVAGVVYFLLGWLFYGNLLADFMQNNMGSATGVAKDESNYIWWALILGNLSFGFLIAYVFEKAGIRSFVSGFTTGAVIGLLVAASIDLTMYGTSNLMTTTAVAVDIAVFTIISAIAGGAAGAAMGTSNRRTTTTV